MRKAILAPLSLLVLGGLAFAQTSSLQTPISQAELDAMRAEVSATIPQPAAAIPPPEMTGGTVGTPGTYRPADARQPRITRSRTVVLAADGTATFDWTAQGPLATPGQVVVTPVHTGAGIPKCWATAVTATSASVKCVVETVALLSILNLNVGSVTNAAPAGLQVGVIALPPS